MGWEESPEGERGRGESTPEVNGSMASGALLARSIPFMPFFSAESTPRTDHLGVDPCY